MDKKILTVVALLFGINFGVYAQSDHIKYKQGQNPQQDGELQIAVTEYIGTSPATSKTRIILYGVVHVADMKYYHAIQRDLDSYDAVLYEGIKQGAQPNKGTKSLNIIQKLMGDVLGLTFQKDGINYRRRHFVHADVTAARLKKQMKGKPISPLERFLTPNMLKQFGPMLQMASKFIKMFMESNPALQDSLKIRMAQQLATADVNAQLPPHMKKAILDDRNALVQRVLTRHLRTHPKHRTIAIFYGAAHMPDFELRLKRMGFKFHSQRWMSAWKMGRGALKQVRRNRRGALKKIY